MSIEIPIKFDANISQNFSIEGNNFLEQSFFLIINYIRKIFTIEVDRKERGFFDIFFIDVLIIFLILALVSFVFQYIWVPSFISLNESSRLNNYIQVLIVLFYCSILWTGSVYLNIQFRELIQTKILPILNTRSFHQIFLYHFFNGSLTIKIKKTYRLYLRTVLILLLLISVFVLILVTLFLANLNLMLNSLFVFLVTFFLIFLLFYVIFTVGLIFLYLLLAVRDLSLDINPLQDKGGTGIFGNFIVNCLYLVSIALSLLPILTIIQIVNGNFSQISQMTHQPVANITQNIKTIVQTSINGFSLDSISNANILFYLGFFLIAVTFAIIIIISIHYQIKKKKIIEIKRLEKLLNQSPLSKENREDLQQILSQYDRILTLHEWPIKNIFVIELLISAIPLIITFISI